MKTQKEYNSDKLYTHINQVCHPCGVAANFVTCLKRFGNPPLQACFSVSTYHKGICDYCGMEKDITETRDFFYPDFTLLEQIKEL